MIPRSFILIQTKKFSDCNTKHCKALNTQRFQTKTQRFQSQCGQVFPHSDFKQNYSAKRQRGHAFPPAISNKNYSAIQKRTWTGFFFHQRFQTKLLSNFKDKWTDSSMQRFEAIYSAFSSQRGQVLPHSVFKPKILSDFKDKRTDSSMQRFQAKYYQSHQERRLTTSFSYQIVGEAKPPCSRNIHFFFLHEHPPKRERRLLAKGKTMSW